MDSLNSLSTYYLSNYLFKYKPYIWYKLFMLNKIVWPCFSETLLDKRYALSINEINFVKQNFCKSHFCENALYHFLHKNTINNKYLLYSYVRDNIKLYILIYAKQFFNADDEKYINIMANKNGQKYITINLFITYSNICGILEPNQEYNSIYIILMGAIIQGDIKTINNFINIVKLCKHKINKVVFKIILNAIINSLLRKIQHLSSYFYHGPNYEIDMTRSSAINFTIDMINLAYYFKFKYYKTDIRLNLIKHNKSFLHRFIPILYN